ncbi:MAG: ribosome recycling factor [Nitriliruptorales bacterium]|nr:ribosome recycling factor [Nitriliruptorales bacterium]
MSTESLDDTLTEAELKMVAAVDHTRNEFAKIRTGRANPQLITDLPVEYYGTHTPLQQLAGVSVPEPRMLLVTPYDRSAMKEIERAISMSDLGLNPSNDGQVVRVVFPELTEERRKQFVRLARERAEEGRIGIRSTRRSARSVIAKLADDGAIGNDEAQRTENRLQDLTDRYVAEIDGLLANKEKELLEV